MTISDADKKLAFDLLETLGETIVKDWLQSRANSPAAQPKVAPSDATDGINALTDGLEQNDAKAESELAAKFPEAQPMPANKELGK